MECKNRSMEDNMFAKILYEKPVCQRNDSKFKRIITWFKRKNYEDTVVKPMIRRLRNESPSYIIMTEMADFIRILELVFFYRNTTKKEWDKDKELKTKLLSDVDMKSHKDDPKDLILEIQDKDVTITFCMYRKYNIETQKLEDYIEIEAYYDFGKKLIIKFCVIDRVVGDFDSIHHYNLLYNINLILQDAMADLFEYHYYNFKE